MMTTTSKSLARAFALTLFTTVSFAQKPAPAKLTVDAATIVHPVAPMLYGLMT